MTTTISSIPVASYGVLVQDNPISELDDVADQIRRIGYAVLDSGHSTDELNLISETFNRTRVNYLENHGEAYLRSANEFHMVRAPLAYGDPLFIRLATNRNLLNVLGL